MNGCGHRWWIVWLAGFLASASVCAQDTPIEAVSDSGEGSSEQVDEDEEAFRRSMELGDSDDEDFTDITSSTPYGAQSSQTPPEDPLPEASREHLDAAMREVIMDVGQWEPADATAEYPYEPSAAAQNDPQLAAEEAAGWQAMIEAYHQREKAAWEAENGTAATAGSMAGAPGDGAGGGGGDGDGNGDGSGSGYGGASAAGVPPGDFGGAADEGEPSGDEGSFSALDYIRGLQGDGAGPGGEGPEATDPGAGSEAGDNPGGQAGEKADDSAGTEGAAEAADATSQAPPEAGSAGASQGADGASDGQEAMAESPGPTAGEPGGTAGESVADAGESAADGGESTGDAETSNPTSGEAGASSSATEPAGQGSDGAPGPALPLPGTLPVSDLGMLLGQLLGLDDEASSEDEESDPSDPADTEPGEG